MRFVGSGGKDLTDWIPIHPGGDRSGDASDGARKPGIFVDCSGCLTSPVWPADCCGDSGETKEGRLTWGLYGDRPEPEVQNLEPWVGSGFTTVPGLRRTEFASRTNQDTVWAGSHRPPKGPPGPLVPTELAGAGEPRKSASTRAKPA